LNDPENSIEPVTPAAASAAAEAPTSTPAAGDFSTFGLDATILRALVEQGYTTPTPIQSSPVAT
jgi:ATP-dependent RNA helicase RhlE